MHNTPRKDKNTFISMTQLALILKIKFWLKIIFEVIKELN